MITCPKCNTRNMNDAINCVDCGFVMSNADSQSKALSNNSLAVSKKKEQTYKNQVQHGTMKDSDAGIPVSSDGVYCSKCGFFNPVSNTECENCNERLLLHKQCQSTKKDGTPCNRAPFLRSKHCWQHNTPFIVSLIVVSIVLALGLWANLSNFTFINPSTSASEANSKGLEAFENGEYDKAMDYFQYAAKKADDEKSIINLSYSSDESRALYYIGATYIKQGEYDLASEYYTKSGMYNVFYNRGKENYSDGEYSQALENFYSALRIVQVTGDRFEEANTLNLIGSMYFLQEEYNQSLKNFNAALDIFQELENHEEELIVINNIGLTFWELGQEDQALEYLIQAENADKLYEFGLEKIDQQELNEALMYFKPVLDITQKVGYREGEGLVRFQIGNTYFYLGKYTLAYENFDQALIINRELGNRLGEGETLTNIGIVYEATEEYDLALSFFNQALVIFEDIENSEYVTFVLDKIESLPNNVDITTNEQ